MSAVVGAPVVRALTVRQPWAWAILHAEKRIENRTRNTGHRGRLYIHAGKTVDQQALTEAREAGFEPVCATAAILGYVDVVGTHHADSCGGRCTEWSEPDRWHWELARPVVLPKPVPCRGALGLWRVPERFTWEYPYAFGGGR